MKFNKVIAIPALALIAGLGLAACTTGTPNASVANPTQTITVTPTAPAPSATTAPPAPAQPPVVVPVQPSPPTVVVPAGPSNVVAGPNTSYPFALNVAAAYTFGASSEYVYSPVTGQSYWMIYSMMTGNRVYATGGNNASVTFTW
jgi:hypothetical protein